MDGRSRAWRDIAVDELAQQLSDRLADELVETRPDCIDLFDPRVPHALTLELTWSPVDGAFVATVGCRRCGVKNDCCAAARS